MSTSNTFLAVFIGSKSSARAAAWNALSESERRAKEREVRERRGAISSRADSSLSVRDGRGPASERAIGRGTHCRVRPRDR